ncbi:conserved hypothetical protein [Thermotomaculum hydrothermale]|uniref:Lipopolysaccharide assembly protein A domain-containing protein n=1 Tax=Thermotomaculum hydrothermale TaxID=981385 RepID=A0A7R6PF40_9BACT|nr:lipopolysaccharide assembly protein LapA domain-containing protein [Thermotomaculum hydrothermale]BBB32568.1 conserved hypothetical protein [Thermotomaculum hydrothermale]
MKQLDTVRYAIWILLLFFVLIMILLNANQTVDFRYFIFESNVIKDIPMFVVIFVSFGVGLLLGLLFSFKEVLKFKKRLKDSESELEKLRREVEAHRNKEVEEFFEKNGDK